MAFQLGHRRGTRDEGKRMKCEELAERVTELLEGVLPSDKKLAARVHLWFCSHCRAYVDQVRRTVRFLAGGQPPAPPPSEVEERIVERILATRKDG